MIQDLSILISIQCIQKLQDTNEKIDKVQIETNRGEYIIFRGISVENKVRVEKDISTEQDDTSDCKGEFNAS